MTHLFIKEGLLIFAAWIVYKQVRNWLQWRALKRFGDQHGCGEAPTLPNVLPGGLERFSILFTGLKGIDFLEDIIRLRFLSMGCWTYRFFNPFNSTIVTTAEPENIQAILATKFNDFDLGPARRDNFFEVLGNGIFTADGEEWQHYRHQLKPQFTRDQVSDLESADRHLLVLFKALPEENSLGWIEQTDILPYIYRFTMDVSTEFLFGESVNSQSRALHSQDSGNTNEAKEDLEFADAMNFVQEYLAWRTRLRGLYWVARSKEFMKACQTIKDFADRFVRLALDPNHKRDTNRRQKFVLLEELVEETRDPVELRDQILHILLAGRDTTSALLSWVFLLLSRHREEFQKLRDVVVSEFGTEGAPTKEMTFSSLKNCKPLTQVLYETLRLYPLIPLNGRRALRDTFLPTGAGPDKKQPFAIRKGEQVGFSAYVMHRRKDLWGEDSENFRPARWDSRKIGWDFIPFGGGPRVCLGQQYALNEAAFVIAKTLQRYDKIEALDPAAPINKGLSLTLSPGDGVKIKLHRATS